MRRLLKSKFIVEFVFWSLENTKKMRVVNFWRSGRAFADVRKFWGQQKMELKKIQIQLYYLIDDKKRSKIHLETITSKFRVFDIYAF